MMQRQYSRPQASQVPYGQHQQQDPNTGYFGGGMEAPMGGGAAEGIHIPRAGTQHYPQQGPPVFQRQQSYIGNYQAALPRRDNTTSKSKCRFDSSLILDVAKVLSAEFLGTFILLFIGCSGFIFMPITFGVAIAVATQIFGDISGAHINPAVTIAAMIMGQISNYVLVPVYIAAQIAGAFIGYALHYVIMGNEESVIEGFCVTRPSSGFTDVPNPVGLNVIGNLFGFEFLMSLFYIMAICSLWDRNHDHGSSMPLKRGFFYTGIVLCMYLGISMPLSMNSLRAIVPLIFSTRGGIQEAFWDAHWDAHWIYWVGPNLGAVFGAGIYRLLKFVNDKSKKK